MKPLKKKKRARGDEMRGWELKQRKKERKKERKREREGERGPGWPGTVEILDLSVHLILSVSCIYV